MLILSESAKSDFPNYHYEVREEAGKCKDGLDMTAEECFIAAKKLGYVSKHGKEVKETDSDGYHPGCWIWVEHRDRYTRDPYDDGILVYYNKNPNGDGRHTSSPPGDTVRSICKIRINGKN